jgi:excinuclease UvrABC nuclease subunit
MPPWQNNFDTSTTFNPTEPLDAFLERTPAKGTVYLFTDESDQPIQLLSVANLRQSLKRRLGGQEEIGPSKRVNYRDLVRKIYWRRVDSRFESDITYYQIARQIFPDSYRGMLGLQQVWFAHVNPDAAFPRYAKTSNLTLRTGTLLGPMEDKHAAARWIEIVEDCFDLCRFYHILVQAPNGLACAYKGMGKCPAPCDGSISMDAYRQAMHLSTRVGSDLQGVIDEQTTRMQAAASDLAFEAAGKMKSYIHQLNRLAERPYRFVRPLEDFRYISLQRGPWANTAKLFLMLPSGIQEFCGLITEPKSSSDLQREILQTAEKQEAIDENITQWMSIVVNHFFAAKRTSGVFLHISELNDRSLTAAFRDLRKQKVTEESEEEGLINELQSL